MTTMLHPDLVLHQDAASEESAALPCCEHYAGSVPKLLKSLALQQRLEGSFDVTADLEDGALSGDETRMARDLADVLRQPRPERHRVGMRVHPPLHPAFESDLSEIFGGASLRLSYITVPKIDHPRQLDIAAHAIARHAMAAGERSPGLQVLVESPAAVQHAAWIAAHPSVTMLAFGQMDFVSSHRGAIPAQAMSSPGQFDHPLLHRAKIEISAACQAAGKSAVHNPTTDYASETQAGNDARRARAEFGFTRMWSIHPGQVSQILRAFAPSESELEDATRILLAAQSAQWGPIADMGRLHDRASYRYYWDLLRRARVQGGVIPAAAVRAFF
jgi:citrate lyase subunit beta/citryl-CoA lyase